MTDGTQAAGVVHDQFTTEQTVAGPAVLDALKAICSAEPSKADHRFVEQNLRYVERFFHLGGATYFLEAPELRLIKIGHSKKDHERRMRALQTASPVELKRRMMTAGGSALERHARHLFYRDCVRGEWFTLTPTLELFMEVLERRYKAWQLNRELEREFGLHPTGGWGSTVPFVSDRNLFDMFRHHVSIKAIRKDLRHLPSAERDGLIYYPKTAVDEFIRSRVRGGGHFAKESTV